MKRIELFWNILYYCTYTLLYSCFCAIDPHRLIDNKYTRKFYKKENIFWQVLDYMKRTEEREKDFSPFILMESIGGTCIFLILLIFTFLNVIMVTTHIPLYSVAFRDVSNFIISFLLLVLLLYVPNQVFLFRNDKYISYFKQFRKERTNKYLICYLFQEVRETEILEAIYLVCAILRYGYSLLLFQLKAYFDIS